MKITVGDTDEGMEGYHCPQCNKEEDDEGGILTVEPEEIAVYHYFCDAGCGFKVFIRVSHIITSIETEDTIMHSGRYR